MSYDESKNIVANKIENDRIKVKWDKNNISNYQDMIGDNLARLRETWFDYSSPAAVSILLQSTNYVISTAAASSDKIVHLGKESVLKSTKPHDIIVARTQSLRLSKLSKDVSSSISATEEQVSDAKRAAAAAKSAYRTACNATSAKASNDRDELLFTVCGSDPSKFFDTMKTSKSTVSRKIPSLKVGNKVYSGNTVPDGFYDSLKSLKAPTMTNIYVSPSYQSTVSDYFIIRKICSAGLPIPEISPREATEFLYRVKPNVNDLYSITARHYNNSGIEGARHFSHLMNLVIKNVNLFSLPELNSVWAMVLHKGHGKPKDSDRSYRTISTCPLLSKCLDKYIGSLYESGWAAVQAETQFQGSGSSHELAALLLTESIQHALFSSKKPLFVLLLDAKSAFDKILVEFLIKNAFLAGSRGQGLLYIADRLSNRKTYVEWDKKLMGPICDLLGVEQGGCLSDRLYKLANNEQLSVAQQSKLGINIGGR